MHHREFPAMSAGNVIIAIIKKGETLLTTVLSSIRTDGSHIAVTYQGGTTGERFVSCLKEHLLTALKPGDVVVMDNLRSHHVREVEEAFAGTGVKYCYSAPCISA